MTINRKVYLTAGILLIISVALAFVGNNLTKDDGAYMVNISTEMLGIVVTILFVNFLYDKRDEENLKNRLIREMGSYDNADAIKAVRELNAYGWTQDGSLIGEQFYGANLSKANLDNADLEEAVLVSADLSEARLENAKCSKALFYSAILDYSSLSGADFSDTKMENASLIGAELDLTNLKGSSINHNQLEKVAGLRYATMPDGTVYDGRYNLNLEYLYLKSFLGNEPSVEDWATFYGISVDEYEKGQRWSKENLIK